MTDSTAQPNPGTSPRRSPLHDRHVALGAEMRDVGGHELPFRYSSELEEHKAVREAVGLFDLSLMGEIRVSGPMRRASWHTPFRRSSPSRWARPSTR